MEINGEKPELRRSIGNSLSTPSPQKPRLPKSWVSALFAKLQGRYGHLWTSSYPPGPVLEAALYEWGVGLAGYSPEEIKRGLDQYRGEYPPTLEVFRQVCRPASRRVHAYYPGLPAPHSDPAYAREQINRLRESRNTGKKYRRRLLARAIYFDLREV